MADDGKTYDIEILREGIYRDMHSRVTAVDGAILRELAESYSESTGPAPLVLGHPKDNEPAYGWVKSLAIKGDKLIAKVGQIPDALREAVRDGRYRKCSASYFPSDHPNNPIKGRKYLRHIGLLGAKNPAIPGLADVAFATADTPDDVVAFADASPLTDGDVMAMLGRIIDTLSIAMAPDAIAKLVPQDVQDAIKSGSPVEPSSLCESLNAADAALKSRLSSLVEIEGNAAQDAVSLAESRNEDFVGDMVREGRLAPFAREDIKRVLIALDSGAPVSFSDASGEEVEKNPADVLRGLLKGAHPIINLGELSKGDQSTASFADEIIRDEDAIRDRMDEARDQGRIITASQAATELGLV